MIMRTYINVFSSLFIGATMLFSCQQAEEPQLDAAQPEAKMTRAFGDKTPIVNIYVETNDVNPLNAGDYKLPNGKPYADIVEFFASNIHKETVNGVVRPTLYLNDKMTNLLERRLPDLCETLARYGHQGAAYRAGRLAEYRSHQHERHAG